MPLDLNIDSWTPQDTSWGPVTSRPPVKDFAFSDRASSGRVGRGQIWALEGRGRAPHYLLCDSPNHARPVGGGGTPPLCHRAFIPGQVPRWWVELGHTTCMSPALNGWWPGWEPIRAALEGEIQRAGWTLDDVIRITRDQAAQRWIVPWAEWEFISREAYEALAAAGAAQGVLPASDDIGGVSPTTNEVGGVFTPPWESLYQVYRSSREAYEEDWRHLEPLFKSVLGPSDFVLEMGGTPIASLLAAEAVDRRCIVIDPRPGVCELALLRWEETTGIKADLA